MSIRRSWLYALFASLGLVGAALVAGSMDFGGDAVRKGAVDGARSAIGVDLEIGNVRGNPFKGYVLESVTLKMKGTPFASAAGLAVRPALMPLLSGKVAIDSITLEGGRIDGDRLLLSAQEGWGDMLLGEQTTKRAQALAQVLRLKLQVG